MVSLGTSPCPCLAGTVGAILDSDSNLVGKVAGSGSGVEADNGQ